MENHLNVITRSEMRAPDVSEFFPPCFGKILKLFDVFQIVKYPDVDDEAPGNNLPAPSDAETYEVGSGAVLFEMNAVNILNK